MESSAPLGPGRINTETVLKVREVLLGKGKGGAPPTANSTLLPSPLNPGREKRAPETRRKAQKRQPGGATCSLVPQRRALAEPVPPGGPRSDGGAGGRPNCRQTKPLTPSAALAWITALFVQGWANSWKKIRKKTLPLLNAAGAERRRGKALSFGCFQWRAGSACAFVCCEGT